MPGIYNSNSKAIAKQFTTFRNPRWWTKQKRNEFVMEANKVARGPSLSIGSSDKQRFSSKWHHETEGPETDANELGHTPPISKDKRLETSWWTCNIISKPQFRVMHLFSLHHTTPVIRRIDRVVDFNRRLHA